MPDPRPISRTPSGIRKLEPNRTPITVPEFYTRGNLVWSLEHQPNFTPIAVVPDRTAGLDFHWKLAAFSLLAIIVGMILAGFTGFLVYQEILTQDQLSQNIDQQNKRAQQIVAVTEQSTRKDISPTAETKLAAAASRPLITQQIANLARKLPLGFRVTELRADVAYSALGADGTPQKNIDPDQEKPARLTGTLTISGKIESTTSDADTSKAKQILFSLFRQPPQELPGTKPDSSQLSFQGMFARTYDFTGANSSHSETNAPSQPTDLPPPHPTPPPQTSSTPPDPA